MALMQHGRAYGVGLCRMLFPRPGGGVGLGILPDPIRRASREGLGPSEPSKSGATRATAFAFGGRKRPRSLCDLQYLSRCLSCHFALLPSLASSPLLGVPSLFIRSLVADNLSEHSRPSEVIAICLTTCSNASPHFARARQVPPGFSGCPPTLRPSDPPTLQPSDPPTWYPRRPLARCQAPARLRGAARRCCSSARRFAHPAQRGLRCIQSCVAFDWGGPGGAGGGGEFFFFFFFFNNNNT